MTTTESRNRFADLRATLRLPVVCAPMFLVSGPELVIAACRAGIVGSFPTTNARSIDIFEEWLDRITGELACNEKNNLPGATSVWAQNMIVHSSYRRLDQELALVQKYRPPIVITALGSPAAVVEAVHDYYNAAYGIGKIVRRRLKRSAFQRRLCKRVCRGHAQHDHSDPNSQYVKCTKSNTHRQAK